MGVTDMNPDIAYLNGQFVPFRNLQLPVWDLGIVQGATVTDMVHVYDDHPFRLDSHLNRFGKSLDAIGISLDESQHRIKEIVHEVIERTYTAMPGIGEFGVLWFATAGISPMYSGFQNWQPDGTEAPVSKRPSFCVHPFPLPLEQFAAARATGVALTVSSVTQTMRNCISPQIKHRSRLHWWIADQQAQLKYPDAKAILLDEKGYLTETNSGNLFIVNNNCLLTPRFKQTLSGITRGEVIGLANDLDLPVAEADLEHHSLANADEAFLTSTTYGILPVTKLNNSSINTGNPGPLTLKLIAGYEALTASRS